jgi:hypothetical protein
MNTPNRQPGIEARLIDILAARGEHAIEMEEFKAAALGVGTKAFWCALSRLEEKGAIFRWKTERFKEYFVLAKHRATAYYLEPIRSITSIFADPIETIIKRSPPFVTLKDEDVDIRNRYAELAVA